jgi:hypothetical protein
MKHCLDGKGLIVYYYFDFNDAEKQNATNMLKSVVLQLAERSERGIQRILSVYSSCNEGSRQPVHEQLLGTLKDNIELYDDVYLILDALDECGHRQELLELIEKILGWKIGKLHFLATSRKEHDIEEAFMYHLTSTQSVCIQSHLVDSDIRSYVRRRIRNDTKFRRWQNKPEVLVMIEESLMDKASGMYASPLCLSGQE